MNGYRLIDRPADIEIEAEGKTFEEALKFSVYAMIEVIADRKKLNKGIKKELSFTPIDYKKDVYKILSEILYIFETESFLPKDVSIRKNKEYVVELKGQKITGKEDFLRTEVKAITYHHLDVKKIDKIWKIRVLFDI